MSEQDRILVIKLSALGDFIQALGAMAAIRNHHKDAHITLLTTKAFTSLAEECGYFDAIQIDERPKMLQIGAWQRLKKFLNEGNFTRIYDLQNNDRTNLYFKLLNSENRPEWVGVAKGASHRNNNPMRTAGHALDGHAQTLALAGIQDVEIDRLDWMKTDIEYLNVESPYVLIISGSAPQHPQKRWPAEYYATLANLLNEKGYQPVLLGTDAERQTTQEIAQQCPSALDLTGKTNLHQIATLAHNADGAVGNDTGPMHIIAATGCPSLTLFSEHSNPKRHAPKGTKTEVLQEQDLKNLNIGRVSKTLFTLIG